MSKIIDVSVSGLNLGISSSSQTEASSEADAQPNTSNVPGAPILGRTSTLQNRDGQGRTSVPLGHTLTVEFRTPDHDPRGRRISRDRRASVVDTSMSRPSGSPAGSRRLSSMAGVVHDDRCS